MLEKDASNNGPPKIIILRQQNLELSLGSNNLKLEVDASDKYWEII
jgi:hypothetical protein